MKTHHFLIIILPAVLLLLPACTSAQEVHSDVTRDPSQEMDFDDLKDLVAGNSEFAFDIYKQITSEDSNLIFSPYSISIALAMTYAGAGGQTAEEMAQALHFTLSQDRLHPAFYGLAVELENRIRWEKAEPGQTFQLTVANSLWGQSGFHFEQDFLDVLALNYGAGMRMVDYKRDTEGARRAINDWVDRSTNQKIKEIIPKGILDSYTRLVLANAVYFQGAWFTPFEPGATITAPFHPMDGSDVDVPMMRMSKKFSGMLGDGFRVLRLPYVNQSYSMWIILPDRGRFRDIESQLDDEFWASIRNRKSKAFVDISFPKFKFEYSPEMTNELMALGMNAAFDPKRADFTGMSQEGGLYISYVLHKAVISVNEKGTEAAASTAVVVQYLAPEPTPIVMEFNMDRPFIFLICEDVTGTILFLGRVTNPAA